MADIIMEMSNRLGGQEAIRLGGWEARKLLGWKARRSKSSESFRPPSFIASQLPSKYLFAVKKTKQQTTDN